MRNAMLDNMILDLIVKNTVRNYTAAWRDAVGAGGACEPPMPIRPSSVPASHLILNTGKDPSRCSYDKDARVTHAHSWTTTKDELGNWWSYRTVIKQWQCLPDEFDMWEGHKTRMQAKARARANASIQRMHQNQAAS